MNYAEFLKAATAPKVVSREIEHDGQTVTFYFRAITADEADDLSIALYGDDGKIDRALFRGNVSRQVAKSLCDEQGKPIATPDEIGRLPVGLRAKLQQVFEDINGVSKEKKDPEAANDSGTD